MRRKRRAIGVFNHRCVVETLHGQPTLFPLPIYQVLCLFFVDDKSLDVVKEDSEYVGLRCIICNASIQMEVKRGGNLTRNTHVLKSHLDSVHYGLATSVSSLYPTMAHLLKDYKWSDAYSASDFSITEQKRIHHFFAKSKEVPTTSEDKVPNQKKTDDTAQDQERRVFIPGET